MTKHKMAKTRIYLMGGIHVDVQGNYEMIKDLLANTPEYWVHFTLEDGTPVSFQRSWIAYITKC
ncbi:hypothetical protein EFM17_04090 [Lactobacillus delbrueckii]|nr:hypothetical protein [Lactobacillus delbrueckii]